MTDFNEQTMKREVYCPFCKIYYNSSLPADNCPNCYGKLLTVVHNSSGEKMTGVIKHEDPTKSDE